MPRPEGIPGNNRGSCFISDENNVLTIFAVAGLCPWRGQLEYACHHFFLESHMKGPK